MHYRLSSNLFQFEYQCLILKWQLFLLLFLVTGKNLSIASLYFRDYLTVKYLCEKKTNYSVSTTDGFVS